MSTTRRRRGGGLLLNGLIAFLVLGLAWLIGLLWFAAALPERAALPGRKTDAIVVLTGGSGRLHQGIELLAAQAARKLFVSGVYRGVEVEELLALSQESPEELQCCITLGYEADDTSGNATETAAWMKDQGFGSLRLVTATYHMPRSMLEFRRAMPDLEIIPHPVIPRNFHQHDWWRWPGSAALIATEYSKYLVALVSMPFAVSFSTGSAWAVGAWEVGGRVGDGQPVDWR